MRTQYRSDSVPDGFDLHEFWIRTNLKVTLLLPSNFTHDEADRLATAVKTFVIDPPPKVPSLIIVPD